MYNSFMDKSRLTILEEIREKGKRTQALCQCSCGNKVILRLSHVKDGNTKSCGCLQNKYPISTRRPDNTTYKTYKCWKNMLDRCFNSKNKAYKDYGGRGILVCQEWLNYEGFLKDMGFKPEFKSLDRINNNRGYFKRNCRWATASEQSNNRRTTTTYQYQGKTLTLLQIAELNGIKYINLYHSIKKGNSLDEAIALLTK